jgi:hypothetical protein
MLARLLAIVLCTALLLPQSGQAHVHLCFDGAGPAISSHVPDSVGPCTHVHAAGHHDHAVDTDSPAVGKAWPPGLDAALFAIVLILLATIMWRPRLLPFPPDRWAPASPFQLRPPLRGPPT